MQPWGDRAWSWSHRANRTYTQRCAVHIDVGIRTMPNGYTPSGGRGPLCENQPTDEARERLSLHTSDAVPATAAHACPLFQQPAAQVSPGDEREHVQDVSSARHGTASHSLLTLPCVGQRQRPRMYEQVRPVGSPVYRDCDESTTRRHRHDDAREACALPLAPLKPEHGSMRCAWCMSGAAAAADVPANFDARRHCPQKGRVRPRRCQ